MESTVQMSSLCILRMVMRDTLVEAAEQNTQLENRRFNLTYVVEAHPLSDESRKPKQAQHPVNSVSDNITS